MRLNLRVALISLVALVAAGGLFNALSGSPAFTPQVAGGGKKSVTLVIDFGQKSGKPTIVKQLSELKPDIKGWDLFASANLSVEGTAEYPTGFVCRIDGWPTHSMQDCESTPTFAQGHWAYFVTNSKMGSTWILSGQGAATHSPECAGYEGWRWIDPNDSSATLPRYKTQPLACQ
jgi:hypothetical protein